MLISFLTATATHNINYWRKPKLLNTPAHEASGNRQRKFSYKIHDCIFDETLHHFEGNYQE